MTTASRAYRHHLSWLYGLQKFGIKLGLENIQRLVAELNITVTGRVVHVAGTNGKGSVCAMIDAISRTEGFRTGLFTSPHLITYRERIRINGRMISTEEVADNLARIRHLISHWDPHPTFFEVTTALALKHFADNEAQVIVLETGLGGRLDATNGVPSDVAVITPIDLDHQKWLGTSIEQIAAEKAGIIKAGRPVVCSPQHPAADKVIRARAAECGSPIQVVDQPYNRGPIGLQGAHQKMNAATAVAAVKAAEITFSEDVIARGLIAVSWPARFQRWDDRLIIDGAHNPAAARVLAKTWADVFGDRRATILLAVLGDKDVAGMVTEFASIAERFVLPPIRGVRALAPEDLIKVVRSLAPEVGCVVADELKQALETARSYSSPILLTGSLHFAGEALALLENRPAAFEECSQ
jgi:dihydrofolate synthase/folylpolyglutamate synthase